MVSFKLDSNRFLLAVATVTKYSRCHKSSAFVKRRRATVTQGFATLSCFYYGTMHTRTVSVTSVIRTICSSVNCSVCCYSFLQVSCGEGTVFFQDRTSNSLLVDLHFPESRPFVIDAFLLWACGLCIMQTMMMIMFGEGVRPLSRAVRAAEVRCGAAVCLRCWWSDYALLSDADATAVQTCTCQFIDTLVLYFNISQSAAGRSSSPSS